MRVLESSSYIGHHINSSIKWEIFSKAIFSAGFHYTFTDSTTSFKNIWVSERNKVSMQSFILWFHRLTYHLYLTSKWLMVVDETCGDETHFLSMGVSPSFQCVWNSEHQFHPHKTHLISLSLNTLPCHHISWRGTSFNENETSMKLVLRMA